MKKLTVMVCLLTILFGLNCLIVPETPAQATKQILIGGGRTDDAWYPFSQALAKFINEKSTWLKAEAISTAGISGNFDMVKESPNKYIGISSFSQIHYRPGHEYSKKRGAYTGDRFIATASTMTQCLVTYDPKLKKVEDLAGKVVDVGRKGAANTPDHMAILEAYGVADKVKDIVYTGYGGGASKMMDGLVDASFLLFNHIYPRTFSKGALIDKLETKAPAYYIGFDRNILLNLMDKEFAVLPVRVPAKALDPVRQPNDIFAFNDPTFFIADEKMDPDIVYEVTRVIWETPASEWAKWHPIGAHMTPEFKPAPPSLKLNKLHPGAKKFYDEKGVKVQDLVELLQ